MGNGGVVCSCCCTICLGLPYIEIEITFEAVPNLGTADLLEVYLSGDLFGAKQDFICKLIKLTGPWPVPTVLCEEMPNRNSGAKTNRERIDNRRQFSDWWGKCMIRG